MSDNAGYFAVPSHTAPAQCKSCKATIYWIKTAAGKAMPVDCNVPGGTRPERGGRLKPHGFGVHERTDGIGMSHFATCPNAAQHRRART